VNGVKPSQIAIVSLTGACQLSAIRTPHDPSQILAAHIIDKWTLFPDGWTTFIRIFQFPGVQGKTKKIENIFFLIVQ
jgi:hypothetical protein